MCKEVSYLNESSILTFGKYSGRRIEEIINIDPGWLCWAINEEILHFDDETYNRVQYATEALDSYIRFKG